MAIAGGIVIAILILLLKKKASSREDSPFWRLSTGYKKMDAKIEKFKLYLMFIPQETEAIWVPIAKLDWGWTGIAESTDGGNTWTKTSGAHDTNNPSGSMTTEFPEWPDTRTDEYPDWQSD